MELVAGIAFILFGMFAMFVAVGIVASGTAPIPVALVPVALAAVFFKWAYQLMMHPQGL